MILRGEDVLNKISKENIHDKPGELTQDDQATSAPKAVSVSIKTAVWIVLKHGRLEIKSVPGGFGHTCEGSLRCGRQSMAWRRHTTYGNERR
jgi:hypothetical protein